MRLNEINMSPAKIASYAKELTDATVGLEFELIVRDFGHDPTRNFVPQPDFQYNQRIYANDWKGLVYYVTRFFNPDYRGSNVVPDLTPLEKIKEALDQVKEQYNTFLRKAWTKYKAENFDSFIKSRDPDNKNDRKTNVTLFRKMYRDRFLRFGEGNLGDWLDSQGLRTQQDWFAKFNFIWPYITTPNHYSKLGNGSRGFDVIAKSFSDATGYPVDTRTGYHAGEKALDKYTIEPDGSLAQNSGQTKDYGLEFVSPPMSISDMIQQIHAVKRWAIDDNNAYTNKTCGLHMNISFPGFDLKNLDYVKLAVFLGDDWVSKQFGRLGHEYCNSALMKIKSQTRGGYNSNKIIGYMKKSLFLAASKSIHDGQTEKYMTINTFDNRVEFRAPGGNWLEMDIKTVISTMQRCAVALSIALDPEKYKTEYAAKLYKLISPKRDTSMELFAQYQSKQISLFQLKKSWAELKINSNDISDKTAELASKISRRRYYQVLNYKTGDLSPAFLANSYEEAFNLGEKYADDHNIKHWNIRRAAE